MTHRVWGNSGLVDWLKIFGLQNYFRQAQLAADGFAFSCNTTRGKIVDGTNKCRRRDDNDAQKIAPSKYKRQSGD